MMRLLVAVALVGVAGVARASDWPFWRGPEQTGMSRENAVVTSWSLDGENLIWKSDVGGRTTPIVMGDRVYMIAPAGACVPLEGGRQDCVALQERVVCLDARNGEIVWERRFNVFHTDIVENRIGWTAVVGDPETGNIYAHGTGGEFFCFDRDGTLVWKVSMTEQFGRISGYGGRLHTPIIDGDRVIVSFLNSGWGSHGRATHRYVAFDKRTGTVAWWSAPGGKPLDTTYAVPVIATIQGTRMLIAAAADGHVYGMRPWNGERVWDFSLSKRGINASVVVDGDYAYVCHSEENLSGTEMGSVVCIDARGNGDITDTGTVWRRDGLRVGYASPAIANGRLYAVDNSANLICLDARTGHTHWKYNIGRIGKGSPTVTADGVIYVGTMNGTFHILRDAGTECVSLDRKTFKRPDGLIDEIFGSPVIANGRVYFQTRYATYCLGDKSTTPSWDRWRPKPGGRGTVHTENTEVAWRGPDARDAILVPGEVTVAPGDAIRFRLQLPGVSGTSTVGGGIRSDDGLACTVKGVRGAIDATGVFTAAPEARFSAGMVTCKLGVADATARIRVAPSLPIVEGFESMPVGSVPPGWVGAGAKTEIVERDGSRVLKKKAPKARPSPPFMRLRVYATPPIPGGYTVQADVLGTERRTRRLRYQADMGLINSRYRMIMLGKHQTLRIESWSPVPRFRDDVAFAWVPEVWYTMKFQVKLRGGTAIVRGKVWPRGEPEPDSWTIEKVDPYPNREGSAGLYGYSNGTTSKKDGTNIFYDNFQVMRND